MNELTIAKEKRRRVRVSFYTENMDGKRTYGKSEETFIQFITVDGSVRALTETDEGKVSLVYFNEIEFIK